ncbi:MAG TPA: FAD-dependent oxidoreductase, partial [bacterium]
MSPRINVVVLGAGYAGLMAAMRLAKKTDATVAITLVNIDDVFHERVRNHQLAAGQSIRQHSLISLLRGTRIRFLQGTVDALQPSQRRITVQAAEGLRSVGYDYLIYALGSSVSVGGVPGVREYAYTLDHASALSLAGRLPAIAGRGGR